MKHLLIFLTILLIASGAYGKGAGNKGADIEATSFSDGILFDVKVRDADLELSISGPGNMATSKRYAYADSAFYQTTNGKGRSLPDGLYKYEARAVPAVRVSREESSRMEGRNDLHGKTDAKMNPVSGTFRIVNGSVVDPNRDEYGKSDLLSGETAK